MSSAAIPVPSLQRPAVAYARGAVRPWDECTLHVASEAVLRSVDCYEGIKGYWQPDGTFALLEMRAHFDRLCRSARVLRLPVPVTFEEFVEAHRALVGSLLTVDRDMWVRANLFAVEGHWGQGNACDLVLTAYHQDKVDPADITLGISTWQRASDLALPYRVKSSSNYAVARLARMEGRERGNGDAVMLNASGRVAETTGACLLLSLDGTVVTPPTTEGALDSITLRIVESIARDLDVPFVRRPVDRTELLVADELAICGTLCEVTRVSAVEGLDLSARPGPLKALARAYLRAVRGYEPRSDVELTPVRIEARAQSLPT